MADNLKKYGGFIPGIHPGRNTAEYLDIVLTRLANTKTATALLDALVEAVPYTIHTVLTDNGIQFADLPKNRNGPTARMRGRGLCRPNRSSNSICRPCTGCGHAWFGNEPL